MISSNARGSLLGAPSKQPKSWSHHLAEASRLRSNDSCSCSLEEDRTRPVTFLIRKGEFLVEQE